MKTHSLTREKRLHEPQRSRSVIFLMQSPSTSDPEDPCEDDDFDQQSRSSDQISQSPSVQSEESTGSGGVSNQRPPLKSIINTYGFHIS